MSVLPTRRWRRAAALVGVATVLSAGTASTAGNVLPSSVAHHRQVELSAPAGVTLAGISYTTSTQAITKVTAEFPGQLGLLSSLGGLLDPYDVYMGFEGAPEVTCSVTRPLGSDMTTAECDWTLATKQPADRPAKLVIRVV